MIRIRNIVRPLVANLGEIYGKQENGAGFHSLGDFLSNLNLEKFSKVSGSDLYSGIQKRTRDDIIASVMLNNYSNQSISLTTGLVTSVSLAGFDGDLFGIIGGNQQICTRIREKVQRSNHFSFVRRKITNTKFNDEGKIDVHGEVFDKIVLAGPIELELEGCDEVIPKTEYQRTVATLIHGELNGEFLNCGQNCPKLILVNDSGRKHLFFNSIEELSDIKGEEAANIYKVFSDHPLSDEELSKLFIKIDAKEEIEWLAYPKYDYKKDISGVKFSSCNERVYITQPIELAASCIEMSLISGANVANLISPIDPESPNKTEL